MMNSTAVKTKVSLMSEFRFLNEKKITFKISLVEG